MQLDLALGDFCGLDFLLGVLLVLGLAQGEVLGLDLVLGEVLRLVLVQGEIFRLDLALDRALSSTSGRQVFCPFGAFSNFFPNFSK